MKPCPVFECGARLVQLVSIDAHVCLGPVGHVFTGYDLARVAAPTPILELRSPVRRVVAWTSPRWIGWTVPEGERLPEDLMNWLVYG